MRIKLIHYVLFVLAAITVSGRLGYLIGVKTNQKFVGNVTPPATISNPYSPPSRGQIDFSLFWDVWDRLSKTYIDKSALDTQKMIYGSIKGMVASLDDPYTVFLPPKENKDAKDELGGQFEGIGAQLGIKDKRIIVVAPLKGMTAEKAGIKSGDWIVKVDDKETFDWTLPEAVSKIRGPKGSSVKLTILHEGDQKTTDISVKRDSIHVNSVEWDKVSVRCGQTSTKSTNTPTGNPIPSCEQVKTSCSDCKQIAHLKLSRFGDKTTEEWDKTIGEISQAYTNGDIKGVVLDLRNNPGGYLQGSVYIASEFLSDGTIVSQQNYDGSKQVYSVNRKGKVLTQPLVVLANKGSASASEIVAGALKVRGRAKIVGQTTFGKGSVQDTQDLTDGAGLHITVAKWLLPDGSWINGKGVSPDFPIEFDDKNPDVDNQLGMAT